MNHYGTIAQQHWQKFLPTRYSQIADPAAFFTQLGQEVQAQITDLTEEIVRSTPEQTQYLRNLGRWNEARTTAEETVLTERVLLPAEPDSPMDEDSEQPPQMSGSRWMPVVEDPTDPAWQQLRELDETS
jgi:hypothetical protein